MQRGIRGRNITIKHVVLSYTNRCLKQNSECFFIVFVGGRETRDPLPFPIERNATGRPFIFTRPGKKAVHLVYKRCSMVPRKIPVK